MSDSYQYIKLISIVLNIAINRKGLKKNVLNDGSKLGLLEKSNQIGKTLKKRWKNIEITLKNIVKHWKKQINLHIYFIFRVASSVEIVDICRQKEK